MSALRLLQPPRPVSNQGMPLFLDTKYNHVIAQEKEIRFTAGAHCFLFRRVISRSTAFLSSTTNVGWCPGRRTAAWWSGTSDWTTESEQGDNSFRMFVWICHHQTLGLQWQRPCSSLLTVNSYITYLTSYLHFTHHLHRESPMVLQQSYNGWKNFKFASPTNRSALYCLFVLHCSYHPDKYEFSFFLFKLVYWSFSRSASDKVRFPFTSFAASDIREVDGSCTLVSTHMNTDVIVWRISKFDATQMKCSISIKYTLPEWAYFPISFILKVVGSVIDDQCFCWIFDGVSNACLSQIIGRIADLVAYSAEILFHLNWFSRVLWKFPCWH